ncbi:Probable TonB-dependent receptor NMB1497 precursor [Serratia quinivorans]|uniref:TonB-dependent receptor domain-containing protein n=1 Tax=Serratia quinivorans TaxID=137545 RepID=UPI0021788F06|nr:TonB-dependent receptor [Serratia quinivorans]CAI0692480.1 Probable TonB-dependent receptor NMB1497 precursor [Serratia quinivorans]CAI0712959.1 Probable TonB-dependent receptor NMB1497 precursor [Serratia quinivorans]CAI1512270.1 Probable TonB-dependent receptor NMB1497 precursor [Serratia quinivorans]CAI2031010.1 Probable TonB-dependent receptor NMB1497 precursor [Serratia quinivorans]CAI2398860.1 Probable TonB-dependent receptor NMB1497 precursor [Serratia quinivorans]
MKTKLIVSLIGVGITLSGVATAAQNEAEDGKGKVVFSPLNVSAAESSNSSSEKEALEKPGAFSSRGENKNLESVDSILRSMPGTYTQIDPGQGSVSVNIRGMSGFGRVNTMVDGITQNYYGSSPSDAAHGGLPTSQFGALIDPNFIVGVDVARGNATGSAGVNALAGSANFRTIGVDDVVFSDNPFGVRTKFSVGNNGIGRSGMIAVGGKTDAFGDGGSLGAMAAISGSSITSNYKNGSGFDSEEFNVDKTYRQNPKSQLFKVDIKPDAFNSIELSARTYQNKITRRHIDSNDFYIKYHYAPFSELIDFNLTASTSRGEQQFMSDNMAGFSDSTAKNISDALDVNNTSRFSLQEVDFAFSYGGKLIRNEYKKRASGLVTDEDQAESSPVGIAGKQNIASLYSGLQLNYGIWQGNFDLNYSAYDISGYKPACDDRVQCFPQGASNINLKEHGFNPAVMLSAQVTPWLQPFVSYNKSMRGPNIQEVFFANSGGQSMNPFLKGETAETYQAGFNANAHDLLFKQDSFQLKAVYFESKIKNYISSQSYMVCSNRQKCNRAQTSQEEWDNADVNVAMTLYSNSYEPVRSRGVEIEAMYDAGFAYSKLSLSKEHTSQPTNQASNVFGAGDISELPELYFTLDTGVRLLDEKLTLGGLVKYTGKAVRLSPDSNVDENEQLLKEPAPHIPTVIDLYSTYQFNRNLLLKFSVQNLMDKDYSDALNKMNAMPSQSRDFSPTNTARGRTYIFGGEVRF